MKRILCLMGQLCLRSSYYTTRLSTMVVATTLFMCLLAVQPRVFGASTASFGSNDVLALNVGDSVPDEWWNMPLTLWTAANDRSEAMTLGEHRGKVIILDFWATWCANCLYGMPDLFDLQAKYGDDILTLPVTYEKTDYVSRFVGASSYDRLVEVKPVFRTVTDNRAFFEYFPLNKSLPLIVVISQDGTIDAIMNSKMLTEEYVGGVVSGSERYAPLKRSRIEQIPPLLEFSLDDVRQYKPVFYTALTGEIDGAESLKEIVRDSANATVRTLLANHTVLELYGAGRYGEEQRNFAFAGPGKENRTVLEVKDPDRYLHHIDERTGTRTVFNLDWRRKNRYTYESVMPLVEADAIQRRIVHDLNRFFGLNGRITNKVVEVWVLRANERLQLNSEGEFLSVNDGWVRDRAGEDVYVGPNEHGFPHYVNHIDSRFLSTSLIGILNQRQSGFIAPYIIDEMDLEEEWKISYGLPAFDELNSIQEVFDVLEAQGLSLTIEEREIPMFVLTEPGYEAKPGEKLVLTRFGYLPESHLDRIALKP